MRFVHLIWRNLLRKKIRTGLTLLSIFVAFLLFGVLMAIKTAFGLGIDITGANRLIMLHKVSIIQPLPYAYKNRIVANEEVNDVSHANWFGGIYQEPKNFFSQFAVDVESYLRLYPEILLTEQEKDAWLRNRTGAVVGRATAERFGWEVGDRIPLQGTIYRRRDGTSLWEFTLEGIYDGAVQGFDTSQFFFHYDYLTEGSGFEGFVGMYVIEIADPDRAADVATGIDSMFANSSAETKTATEKAFIQAFANQTGNIAAIVTGILAIVFFTLLLVAGNTIAISVRERIKELAVMKTVGFTDSSVMSFVMCESMLLAFAGGLPALALVAWLTRSTNLGGAMLPTLHLSWGAIGLGAALIVTMGMLTGLLPALQAQRLTIIDALARRS